MAPGGSTRTGFEGVVVPGGGHVLRQMDRSQTGHPMLTPADKSQNPKLVIQKLQGKTRKTLKNGQNKKPRISGKTQGIPKFETHDPIQR